MPTSSTHENQRAEGSPTSVSDLATDGIDAPPLWTVSLVFVNDDGELPIIDNETRGRILLSLTGGLPVLGFGDNYVAFTLDVHADDHRTASTVATATCDDALHAAGLPPFVVTECQTVRTDRLEAATARTPDFVGVTEIAEILGVSKQRAWQRTKAPSFPAIACHPKAGPLWRRCDIANLKMTSSGRPPGRRP